MDESNSTRVRRDLAPVVLTFGVLMYVLRVVGAVWRSDLAPFFPDSFSYVAVAQRGPFDADFWFGERPVGTPLVLWLCGNDVRLFVLVQTLIYAVGVALLCATLLRIIHHRAIGWITVSFVAAVACQPRFGIWHLEVLSESLGLGLGFASLALWLRAVDRPQRGAVIAAVTTTSLWAATRDSHALVAGVVVVGILVAARRCSAETRQSHDLARTLRRSAAALTLVIVYVIGAQAASERNQYPLFNNIGLRILPDEGMTESFAGRGMPLDDAVRSRVGADTWDDDAAFLRSPDLADLRTWVRGSGQWVQMSSLVVDADFWLHTTADVLPASLAHRFGDYDRFGVRERLPDRLFWFEGVRTSAAFGTLAALSGAALVALARLSRRRAAVFGLAAVACGIDIYVSATTDAVEVLRHLVGPNLRFQVVGLALLGMATDAVVGRVAMGRSPRRPVTERRPVAMSTALAFGSAAIGVFIAWVGLETRSQDFDPQYVRTIVERAAAFGGTYYQNGIHNKGPLETAVYDSVRLFTSYEGYWFGISVYVIIAAGLVGLAAWAVARSVGGSRSLAAVAASLVIVHFTVSTSDYAGVLYSRNITSTLLASVLGLAVWPRPWSDPRRSRLAFIACGIAIGLSVQTLLTTALVGGALALYVVRERSRSTSLRHPILMMAAIIVTTVLGAPLWYALRGSFAEFWAGWWTYARYMNAGTGRDLADQFGLGFTRLVGYYQERPEAVAAIAAFMVLTRVEWSRFSVGRRRLHLVLSAWFVGGWIELVVSQRYSSHYFSVIAVPTVLMATSAGVTALHVVASRGSRPRVDRGMRPALLATLVLVLMQGTDVVWAGIEGASRFRNVPDHVADRPVELNGATLTSRAVLDLVSTRGDALLGWTMYPWSYLANERVPATRFIWKSFLIGEIYLGRTSPAYVLPQTDRWFAEDLAESRPRAAIRPIETFVVPGTPYDAAIKTFDVVYTGPDVEIGFDASMWARVRAPLEAVDLDGPDSPLDLPVADPGDIGWSVDVSQAEFMASSPSRPLRLLSAGACWRIDATLVNDADTARFVFDSGDAPPVHISFSQFRAWSGRGTQIFLEQSLQRVGDAPLDVTLLIGPRSAALVVDDKIVAAVSLSGPSVVSLEALSAEATVREVRIGRADALQGC